MVVVLPIKLLFRKLGYYYLWFLHSSNLKSLMVFLCEFFQYSLYFYIAFFDCNDIYHRTQGLNYRGII